MSFVDLSTPAGLKAFDEYIAAKTYIQGYMPTTLDLQALSLFSKPPSSEYSHALRYYNHILSFSESDRKNFRAGGEVPAQIAGSVKAKGAAPAPAAKAAAPAKEEKKAEAAKAAPAAAAPAAGGNAALEEAIKAQGEVVRKLKADKVDKSVLQPELDKLLALKAQAASGAAAPAAAAPAKEEKKQDKKEEKKEKKDDKKKEEKKEEKKQEKKEEKKPATAGGHDDKLVKAVQKEGGKKGQDIIGVHEMGGLEFFCTSVDTPDGDFELLNMCLDAMNAEVDESSEEKRGGAAPVGKMIFSAGVKQLAIVARVPEDKAARVNLPEWLKHVVDKVGGKLVGTPTATYGQAVVEADADKGRFPIKLKDIAIPAAVEFLQQKGLLPQSTDDDDDDVCYGDDAFDE